MASNHLDSELYYLVAKFLSTGPCQESAQLLRDEIQQNGLLPPRLDWTGGEHRTTFADIDRHNTHISADYLKRIVQRINGLLDAVVPPSISGVSSLLGDGQQSLLRSPNSVVRRGPRTTLHLSAFRNGCQMLPSSAVLPFHPPNVALSVISRENSGSLSQRQLLPTKCYDRYIRYRRLLGHLSSVYCVAFDRTGRYIFTGADDSLVKIWSATDGRLLSTLRGHINEITDLTINFENTLIAAGSCDKMIRVWCLKTTAPMTVLNGHTAAITSVKFCPLTRDNRYLVSTANDGCVCFWKYSASTNEFQPRPIKFQERHKPNSQLVCSSFSAGGVFLAIGSTDNYLRVYHITAPAGPTKILEIEQHSDTVDSLQFSNLSTRFVSGSKDGIAHIWYFERQHWHNIPLKMSERLPGSPPVSEEISRKIRVSMVGWTCDDIYVITSLSDHSLKVWCSRTGQLKHVLYGHEDEVFVIEAHPKDSRIFLSGGHDGAIILWDVLTGTQIKHFFNGIDGQGHGAVFDCKFAPDGLMFASTDSHGHLSLFGMLSSEPYKKMPEQVFFHTDYRPVIRDSNHYAIDEQTQCAPHLMPPPFLVDIDGNPYPPNYQRLVPGRETCSDSQLVPYVAVHNANGNDVAEVLAPVEPIDPQHSVQLASAPRPTIDDMIQRLQREQRRLNNEHNYIAHPSHQQRDVHNSPGRVRHASGSQRSAGSRRTGTVGVRQPANFMSRDRNLNEMVPVWAKKMVVSPLNLPELEKAKHKSIAIAETEETFFTKERRKRPQTEDASVSLKLAIKEERFTRRKRRIIQQRQGVRQSGPRDRFPRRPDARHGITDFENPEDLSDESDSDFTVDKEWADTSNDSDESEETEESEWDAPSTSRARRSHRSSGSDEQSRSSEEPNDRPMKPLTKKEAKKLREKMKRKQYEEKYNAIKELPEEFRPPDWFTGVEPKKTPYFPQIGDEVVYFRSGHQHYIDKVREQKMYPINPNLKPFKARGSQSDEVFAIIEDIKYDVKPPRLVTLKLVVIAPDSNEQTGGHFSVRYHDVEGVVDFIVLRRLYQSSLNNKWKVGDEFRSIIDDKWWFGTIEKVKESEPESKFQCFDVLWASGDRESLSPWDLERIDPANLPPNRTLSVAVTDEEKRALNVCIDEDWGELGREQECNRILEGLTMIMTAAHAEEFLVPVDVNQHPVYGMMIAYPMDLSTIKQRLENRFYRRLDAVKFDAKFIELNAQNFNESGSEIVKKARLISALITEFIDDSLCLDPMPIYGRMVENYIQFSDPADTEESRDDDELREVRRSARKKRRRSGSESEGENRFENEGHKKKKARKSDSHRPRSWKRNCLELLNYLLSREDSTPFRTAVDPIQYPDYNQVIDTPMDMTTVKEQLLSDLYNNPNEFSKDMRLIFLNSKSYNTNKSSQIYKMTLTLSRAFEEGLRPIISNWKSNVKYESNLKRGIVSRRRKPLPLSPIGPKRSPTKRTPRSPTAKRRRRALSSSMSPTFDISLPSTSGYSSRSKSSQSNADKVVDKDSKQKPKTSKSADNQRKNGANRSLKFRSTNVFKRKANRRSIAKRVGDSSDRPKRNCRKRVKVQDSDDDELTVREDTVEVKEEDMSYTEEDEEAIGSDVVQHFDSDTEIEDDKSERKCDQTDTDSDATEIEDETELLEEVEDLARDQMSAAEADSLRQSYSEHTYTITGNRRTERLNGSVVRSKRERLKASEDSEFNQTSSASSSHSNYSNETHSSANTASLSPAISDLASDQSSMSDEHFNATLKRSQRTRRTSWRNRFDSEEETDLRRVGLGLRNRQRPEGSSSRQRFPYLSESPKIKTRSRNSGKERVRYTFDDDDFEYDNVSGAHLNDAQSVSSRGRVRKFKAHAGVARLRH